MSASPKPRYIVDEDGRPSDVVLDIRAYERMLEELEELESIRAYDAAKSATTKRSRSSRL